MEITGTRGVVKVGYNRAAAIRGWSLTRDDLRQLNNRESQLVCRIAMVDEFWAMSKPTRIALDMGGCWWVWDQLQVQVPLVPGTQATINLIGNPIGVSYLDGLEAGHGNR